MCLSKRSMIWSHRIKEEGKGRGGGLCIVGLTSARICRAVILVALFWWAETFLGLINDDWHWRSSLNQSKPSSGPRDHGGPISAKQFLKARKKDIVEEDESGIKRKKAWPKHWSTYQGSHSILVPFWPLNRNFVTLLFPSNKLRGFQWRIRKYKYNMKRSEICFCTN